MGLCPQFGRQSWEEKAFGATTPELERMAEWLKQRQVESVPWRAPGCTGLRRMRCWRGMD